MLHLTVANTEHPGLTILLESAKRFASVQTRVLGLGNHTPIGHGGAGFGLKLKLLHDEVRLLPPLQPVLFTDAFDVILQRPLDGLLHWIDAHPGKVLFAAERAKWPDEHVMYPVPLQMPFPYLNSGVFGGRAVDILRLLDSKPYDMKTDDQGYYTDLFLKGDTIVLDHKAEFFLCFFDLKSSETTHREHQFYFKGHNPPVLHFNNGGSRYKWYKPVATAIMPDQAGNAIRVLLLMTFGKRYVMWLCIWSLLLLCGLGFALRPLCK